MSSSSPAMPPQAAAAQFVIQLATGHIVASALQVVVRLGIPDSLARGPRTSTELAQAAGVPEDTLYRVLRALASVGLFVETPPRRFSLTEAGELLVSGASPRIEAMGLPDRCRLESGDFFEAIPEGGDAYILKHIIHDWDDARATAILRNIRTAMAGKRGRVILLESVLHPGNAPDFG